MVWKKFDVFKKANSTMANVFPKLIYVGPCKTVKPYVLSRPYKLSQHRPLTSAAGNSALLGSLFLEVFEIGLRQHTSFQSGRSRAILLSGLQEQKLIEVSFWLNVEAFV